MKKLIILTVIALAAMALGATTVLADHGGSDNQTQAQATCPTPTGTNPASAAPSGARFRSRARVDRPPRRDEHGDVDARP